MAERALHPSSCNLPPVPSQTLLHSNSRIAFPREGVMKPAGQEHRRWDKAAEIHCSLGAARGQLEQLYGARQHCTGMWGGRKGARLGWFRAAGQDELCLLSHWQRFMLVAEEAVSSAGYRAGTGEPGKRGIPLLFSSSLFSFLLLLGHFLP